jgi:RNase P/RNase MRP subunit p30|tara:strand:- start:392 stop:847 length:456 start_codon:yes stop_codon:yes gene_type:complete
MKPSILIQEKTFEKARNEIRKNNDKTIIFSSNNDDLNRKILEKEKIKILLLNQSEKKDFMKQRNSGLNQVLAKIAKKKNIIIGINFDEILSSSGKRKAEIFARIKQNIKLCNKNKLKMKFIFLNKKNNRDIHDLKSLGLVLGMPTSMIRDL